MGESFFFGGVNGRVECPETGVFSCAVVGVEGEEALRRSEGCLFKPAVELIQIVCQLLIIHSAGGWCLVVGDLFQTFPH